MTLQTVEFIWNVVIVSMTMGVFIYIVVLIRKLEKRLKDKE
jgi:hypothetical protein